MPRHPERVFASACSGVYRSQNRREKWAHLDTPKGAFRTHFVALDPGHPKTWCFAGTTGGLLRSTDAGQTWRTVSAESIKSIAFDPGSRAGSSSRRPPRACWSAPMAG